MNPKIKVLFSSWSANIGDDVQTFAVEQLLGKVDGHVDRENISAADDRCILVSNGWWKHRPEDFPPHPALVMAYTGIHVALPDFWLHRHRDHFLSSGAIGCRDKSTLDKFKREGIPSYLSNCLTLGLQRWMKPDPLGPVIAVDLHTDCRVPEETVRKSHEGPVNTHPDLVRSITLKNLESYQTASLVITSRLHVALPCLAFGTPVCFVTEEPDDPRFGCLRDLVPFQRPSSRLGFGGNVMRESYRRELGEAAKAHLDRAIEEAIPRLRLQKAV